MADTIETVYQVMSVEQRTSLSGDACKRDIIPVVEAIEQKLDESPLDKVWFMKWEDLTLPQECKFNPENELHIQYVEQIYKAGNYDVCITGEYLMIAQPMPEDSVESEQPTVVKPKSRIGQKIKNLVNAIGGGWHK